METKVFSYSELRDLRSALWSHSKSKSLDYRFVDLIHLVMLNSRVLGIEL